MNRNLEERASAEAARSTSRLARESQIEDYTVIALFEAVIMTAARYWEDTRDYYDFCVQAVSPTSMVFGSTNRLIWTPAHGFRPDRSYCNNVFLATCDRLGPLPGNET